MKTVLLAGMLQTTHCCTSVPPLVVLHTTKHHTVRSGMLYNSNCSLMAIIFLKIDRLFAFSATLADLRSKNLSPVADYNCKINSPDRVIYKAFLK
jgi:hypothetical protein